MEQFSCRGLLQNPLHRWNQWCFVLIAGLVHCGEQVEKHPLWMPRVSHHDDWLLVKQRLFALHQKTSQRINHDVSQKMTTRMFHRHIPNYTSPTVSHLDPRQRKHPDNVETWRNVGGGHGSISQVACICPVWLSTTIKLLEDISFTLSPANSLHTHRSLEVQKWRKHFFWHQRSWAEGFSNHY